MYFDIQKIFNKYEIDYISDSAIICINGIRNIGKTTSVLNWVMEKINKDCKIGFFRNNEEQLKTFRQDFNNRFAGKFMISGNCVYNVKTINIKDENGEDTIAYRKNELVGYCGSLNAYTKIKSIEAANIRYIIFDEYNEDGLLIRDIYTKWINMLKTLSRFNKVCCIMLGNRDTPNNEFMVKWGVIPQEDNDFREDWVYKFSARGWFIELGSAQFDDLGNADTLADELSKFDKDTERYLNGGYAAKSCMQVVPYMKVIHKTFEPLWKLAVNNEMYVFGTFEHDKIGTACALVGDRIALERAEKENLIAYSLDSRSYQTKETKLNNVQSQYAITEKLLRLHKQKRLYYDTFNIMLDITDKMVTVHYK